MSSIRTALHRAVTASALVAAAGCLESDAAFVYDTAGGRVSAGPPRAHRVGTVEGFYGPEGVKYDPDQDVYFVSNMLGFGSAKDGDGYIVRVDAADLGRSEMFIRSGKNGVVLDAPKGMAIHGDTLWVTDIDVLRAFDRHSGAPLATVDLRAQGAVLLNDIAVGPDGALRVTDSGIIMSDKGVMHPGGDKVFLVGPNRAVSVLAEGNVLGRPNGITWDPKGRRWIVVSFDPFHSEVYTLNAGTDARTVLARGSGKFDGVEVLADGRLLVTSWSDSSVHAFGAGRDERIIRGLINPADLGLDTRRNRVAVPLVTMNRVEFWQLPVE